MDVAQAVRALQPVRWCCHRRWTRRIARAGAIDDPKCGVTAVEIGNTRGYPCRCGSVRSCALVSPPAAPPRHRAVHFTSNPDTEFGWAPFFGAWRVLCGVRAFGNRGQPQEGWLSERRFGRPGARVQAPAGQWPTSVICANLHPRSPPQLTSACPLATILPHCCTRTALSCVRQNRVKFRPCSIIRTSITRHTCATSYPIACDATSAVHRVHRLCVAQALTCSAALAHAYLMSSSCPFRRDPGQTTWACSRRPRGRDLTRSSLRRAAAARTPFSCVESCTHALNRSPTYARAA